MTFADLKAELAKLTPAQLAVEVEWSGDERGGKVQMLWIAEEDWLGTEDGDCEPRSVLDPEDAASAMVIIPAGTPQLLVDP
jgi:hypothetical protein